ncbi:hypothetical protein QJQ45_002145 [Haematococcus lacustris]|nr:hypothetical protein QJQ45_002145 [Haematococcus lacustris]
MLLRAKRVSQHHYPGLKPVINYGGGTWTLIGHGRQSVPVSITGKVRVTAASLFGRRSRSGGAGLAGTSPRAIPAHRTADRRGHRTCTSHLEITAAGNVQESRASNTWYQRRWPQLDGLLRRAPQPGRWLDRDCNAALNKQRIGERRWRPLELCYWPDQGALPAKGKQYPEHGYKRVRDTPPKAHQQQQPAGAQ